MKHQTRFGRLALLALALTIVLGLPLSASAQGTTEADQAQIQTRLADLTRRDLVAAQTTRGEYVRLLYLAAGAPSVSGQSTFVDVLPEEEWFVAITWAEQAGIARRGADGAFHPRAQLTRADQEDLLARTLSALGTSAQKLANSLLAAYSGRTEDEDWALTPAALAERLGSLDQETVPIVLPNSPGYSDRPCTVL